MAKATRDNTKLKPRPKQAGTFIGVRAQDDLLAAIDDWRRTQDDLPGRAEAIRRLVDQALDAPKAKAKAKGRK